MKVPLSAMIGLFFTTVYFFIAIFAPWIAPYGLTESVGDVWEPMSQKHFECLRLSGQSWNMSPVGNTLAFVKLKKMP